MSAPAPRANPILLGHEAAERTLLDAIQVGRMHHAWLISGAAGIGKATLAFRFARRLLAGETRPAPTHRDPPQGSADSWDSADTRTPHPATSQATRTETLELDPAHPVFRRVMAAGHADILTIERALDDKTGRRKRDIAIADVRKINGFMALTPAEGGWRIAVVDGAEDLNQNSANALLKILEEPPSRAILLLVCSAPGRLPATIRSRCRQLRLSPLTDAVMARLLALYLPEQAQDERDRLVTLAEGSIGRALAMANEDGIAVAALVDNLMTSLPNVPLSRGHDVADALGRNEMGFRLFTDQLIAGIAALVRDGVRGRADPEQQRLAGLRPLEAWGELWQGLLRLQDETERYALDKRQALVSCVGMLIGKMP